MYRVSELTRSLSYDYNSNCNGPFSPSPSPPVPPSPRVDPYTKKDWYDVKAPSMFSVRNIGKTLVTKTQGKSESMEGISSSASWEGEMATRLALQEH